MIAGGKVQGLNLPKRVFPCATPEEVRATLPEGRSVLAFQCRNPIHRAHYELFIRALDAPNAGENAVCLVHPTCGPTQVAAQSSDLIIIIISTRIPVLRTRYVEQHLYYCFPLFPILAFYPPVICMSNSSKIFSHVFIPAF